MYKLIFDSLNGTISVVKRMADNMFIPFDAANTDYQQFKSDILENKAELQDAEGNTMTAQDAQAFVATLP